MNLHLSFVRDGDDPLHINFSSTKKFPTIFVELLSGWFGDWRNKSDRNFLSGATFLCVERHNITPSTAKKKNENSKLSTSKLRALLVLLRYIT